ncbi:MAG TPA: SIS domain-containing protein [Methanomassiliicoccales archaeon]|nr:SIS domain-containing protein [Methanomassiliicoccales archaeon]HPR98315.1 SIS domain-containing protein [Methanomassiliicoccales archaeon]
MKETTAYILEEVRRTIEKVDEPLIDDIVTTLAAAPKIFIYGVGRSGLVGEAFAARLVQIGLNVHFVGDTTTPIVEKGHVVLIISNTGETMSAVQTANIVRRLGAVVISVTGSAHSKLGIASNMVMELVQPRDERKKKNAPLGTIFELSSMVMLDSMVPLLMSKLDQDEASLRRRHAIWV